MQKVKWGEYKLSELFEVKTTRSIDKNKITFDKNGDFDFIGRSNVDNGIQGKIKKLTYEPNPKNTFSLVQVGESVCLFRKNEWYASQNIFLLTPLNERIAKTPLFVISAINKAMWKYKSAYIYPTLEEVKRIKIQVPVKNGGIDFEFMESFIAELEKWYIAELEAYLFVSGFKDYNLSTIEQQTLTNYINGKIKLKEYNISELFRIDSYKKCFDANKVTVKGNGKFPYVVRMSTNNGQKGFIDEDEEYLNEGNTVSFGQDTATMFYQEKPYFTGDKIKILKPKHNKFGKENAQFFIAAMSKSFCNFSWGSSSFNVKVIENQKIVLPTKGGQIDFHTIEILILAIQKMVIKDVVIFSEEKIKLGKKVERAEIS